MKMVGIVFEVQTRPKVLVGNLGSRAEVVQLARRCPSHDGTEVAGRAPELLEHRATLLAGSHERIVGSRNTPRPSRATAIERAV